MAESDKRDNSQEPELLEPELAKNVTTGQEKMPVPAKKQEGETIEQPSKVIRMGSMLGQLLEEVRNSEIDESGRERLKEIYELSVKELGSAVSSDLKAELARLARPFQEDEVPTGSELRVAKAQLVGWLEGLVQGIQATLYAQQVAARQQLSNIRQKIGSPPQEMPEEPAGDGSHGTYL